MASPLLLAVLMMGSFMNPASAGQYPRLDEELRSAAEVGDADMVRALIDRGADANAANPSGSTDNTPLYNAAEKGHVEVVRLLLEHRADANVKNKYGVTALQAAISRDRFDIDVLKALLEGGANPNVTASWGATPLMEVAMNEKGSPDALRVLLDHGADIKPRNEFGTALCLARTAAEAALLLDRGADINSKCYRGHTLLMISTSQPDKHKLLIERGARSDDTLFNAVSASNRDAVKRLLEKGAGVNAHLPYGETPLMFAAMAGDVGIVEDLLAHGASVDARTKDMAQTALFWAANGPVAEALIKRGAEIEAKDSNGWTPIFAASADKTEVLLAHGARLDVAAKDGCTVMASARTYDSIKVLLTRGADANKEYGNRYSALFWAVYNGNKDIVRLLLEHGVSTATFDNAVYECKDAGMARVFLEHWTGTIKKSTLLAKAVPDGNIEMTKALLEGGADVDEADGNGQTALSLAAELGKVGVLKVLLEQDVRPETKSKALAEAVDNDRTAAVKILLENDTDPNDLNRANGQNSPALSESVRRGNAGIVDLLLAAGANPNLPIGDACKGYLRGYLKVDIDLPPCPKDRIEAALDQARSKPAATRKSFWVPKKDEARLAAGDLVWGAKKQAAPPSDLVSGSKTVWQNLSAVATKLISDDIDQFVGRAKPDAPTLVQDQYESRSQFEAKVAAAKSKYAEELRAYREKVASYPVWRRNAILETALNSVLGVPGVAAKRQYDADSQTFAPEIVSEGGFKQAFVLSQTVPNDKAADFDKALQGAKMKVFFQLKGTGMSATAAEFQLLGTRYHALPAQGSIAGEQKLARVELGDAAPAGPEALHVDYSDNPELAQKVAELENLKRKKSQTEELKTLEAQIAQLKKGEEKTFHSDVDAPAFAPKAGRPNDFALIVGIESYQDQDLPKADFAERDAQSVARYFTSLGVPPENVKLLKGQAATAGKIKGYLGSWLAKNVKPDSRVFFYFSGHGAPDPESRDAYLVSWDGDPQFLKTTAVSLTSVYEDLGKLKAKQVLVAMDACFSGTGSRSVMKKGARPLVILQEASAPSQITVLAAAGNNEIAGSFEEQGHGTFTYYLLKGLEAGSRDSQALFDYLKPKVQDKAALSNATQVPVYRGPDFAF